MKRVPSHLPPLLSRLLSLKHSLYLQRLRLRPSHRAHRWSSQRPRRHQLRKIRAPPRTSLRPRSAQRRRPTTRLRYNLLTCSRQEASSTALALQKRPQAVSHSSHSSFQAVLLLQSQTLFFLLLLLFTEYFIVGIRGGGLGSCLLSLRKPEPCRCERERHSKCDNIWWSTNGKKTAARQSDNHQHRTQAGS